MPAGNMKLAYVAKPRLVYLEYSEDQSVTADQVIEQDSPDHVDTGLVNAQGVPLYRVRERVAFGFVSYKK